MKISVITAVYNCRPYLKDCIKSVRSQNYDDYEHLIIDDCSTDGSYKYLRKICEGNSKIKLFKAKKRLHCGSAYSFLAQKAQGDIVAVLDADDALTKGALSTLSKLYEQNPEIGYIWTQFWLCNSHLEKIKKGFSKYPGDQSLLSIGMNGKHYFSHWRTFRRSILDQVNVFKSGLKSAVDKYMAYSLEEVALGGFADVSLYKYRLRFGGLSYTGRKNWKKIKQEFFLKRQEKQIIPLPIKLLEL